jgi:hypothetical protein
MTAQPAGSDTTDKRTCEGHDMRYRHERMIRAREERKAQHFEREQDVEAALRSSLTEEESRLWQVLSEAVGQVV